MIDFRTLCNPKVLQSEPNNPSSCLLMIERDDIENFGRWLAEFQNATKSRTLLGGKRAHES